MKSAPFSRSPFLDTARSIHRCGGLITTVVMVLCLPNLSGPAVMPRFVDATETFPCHDSVYAAWSTNFTTFDNSVLVHYMGSAPSFIQFADGTYAIFFVNFDLGTTNKRTSVRTSIDFIHWTLRELTVTGVAASRVNDPMPVMLPNGSIRLYYLSDNGAGYQTHYSLISTVDEFTYIDEGIIHHQSSVSGMDPMLMDPEVVLHGSTFYHFAPYASAGTSWLSVSTSSDGYTWTPSTSGTISLPIGLPPGLLSDYAASGDMIMYSNVAPCAIGGYTASNPESPSGWTSIGRNFICPSSYYNSSTIIANAHAIQVASFAPAGGGAAYLLTFKYQTADDGTRECDGTLTYPPSVTSREWWDPFGLGLLYMALALGFVTLALIILIAICCRCCCGRPATETDTASKAAVAYGGEAGPVPAKPPAELIEVVVAQDSGGPPTFISSPGYQGNKPKSAWT